MINAIVIINIMLSTSLLIYILLKRFVFNKSKVEITYKEGWYHLDYASLFNSKKITLLMSEMAKTKNIYKFNSDYVTKLFQRVKYKSIFTLIEECVKVNNKISFSKEKNILRRYSTASGIIFNFKVPEQLWLLDDETLKIIIEYNLLCSPVTVNLDTIEVDTLEKDNDNLTKILECIDTGIIILSKIGNNKAPNILTLTNLFIKDYNKVWLKLDKNSDNVAKLMTIVYLSARLDIPKDYLKLNTSIYNYLKYNIKVEDVKEKKAYLRIV